MTDETPITPEPTPTAPPVASAPSRAYQILVPLIAVIALGALGAAIFAKASDPSTGRLSSEVSSLRAQLSNVRGQLAASDNQISSLKDNSQAGEVGSLVSEVHRLKLCLPQVQQEINSMSINQNTQNGYVTNAYLQNPTIISQDCTKTINGG